MSGQEELREATSALAAWLVLAVVFGLGLIVGLIL